MNNKKILSEQDQAVISKIAELIPMAPNFWAKALAALMKKSEDSVYAYVRGDRGIRKGYHKDVLRLLKKMTEDETERTNKLLK